MFVVGFDAECNSYACANLDIDPQQDSPRKIVNMLKKKHKGKYTVIICIENDEEVASFIDGVDYDLSDDNEEETDNDDEEDEDADPDHLHEEDIDDE